MTHEEVQALIDQIPCDLCYLSKGQVHYAALAAMVDIANGDPVPATTQELLTEARCLMSCVPPGLVPYLQVQLLRDISENGGGGAGSSTCCSAGTGSPEGVVSGSPGKTYIDTASGGFWVKLTGTNTTTGWLQLIGP